MSQNAMSSSADPSKRDYFIAVNEAKVAKGSPKSRLFARNTCVDCGDPLAKRSVVIRCAHCDRTFQKFLEIRKILKVGQSQNVLDLVEATGIAIEVMFALVRVGYLRRVEPSKLAELAARGCEVCRRPTDGESMCRGCRERFQSSVSKPDQVAAAARQRLAEKKADVPAPVLAAAETAAAVDDPAAIVQEKPAIRVKDRRSLARQAGASVFADKRR